MNTLSNQPFLIKESSIGLFNILRNNEFNLNEKKLFLNN